MPMFKNINGHHFMCMGCLIVSSDSSAMVKSETTARKIVLPWCSLPCGFTANISSVQYKDF